MRPPELNWLQRKAIDMLGLMNVKSSAATSAVLSLIPGAAVWKTRNYYHFAREGYIQNSDVYSCINLISGALKSIRVYPYRLDSDNKPAELKAGPLVDLLKRPNPQQSWPQFAEAWISFLLTAGNSYIERSIGTSPARPPVELYVQRPDRVQIEKGDRLNPIAGYRYIPEGIPASSGAPGSPSDMTWPADLIGGRGQVQRLLHLKFFHPNDDWYGLSVIEANARNIDQNNEAQIWNVATLQNGMRPSGALVFEGNLGAENRERLEGQLREKHSGAQNAGKTIVVEGSKFTFQELSRTAVEMDWLEGQRLATRRICSAFKVPPQLIGDEQAKTYANYEEARKAFYQECILPLVDFLTLELSHWLAPFFGQGVYIGYDKNSIQAIQEDRQIVHTRAKEQLDAGLITLNEAREMVGQPPVSGGDVFYVPMNLIVTPEEKLGQLASARTQQAIAGPTAAPPGKQPPGKQPPARGGSRAA